MSQVSARPRTTQRSRIQSNQLEQVSHMFKSPTNINSPSPVAKVVEAVAAAAVPEVLDARSEADIIFDSFHSFFKVTWGNPS